MMGPLELCSAGPWFSWLVLPRNRRQCTSSWLLPTAGEGALRCSWPPAAAQALRARAAPPRQRWWFQLAHRLCRSSGNGGCRPCASPTCPLHRPAAALPHPSGSPRAGAPPHQHPPASVGSRGPVARSAALCPRPVHHPQRAQRARQPTDRHLSQRRLGGGHTRPATPHQPSQPGQHQLLYGGLFGQPDQHGRWQRPGGDALRFWRLAGGVGGRQRQRGRRRRPRQAGQFSACYTRVGRRPARKTSSCCRSGTVYYRNKTAVSASSYSSYLTSALDSGHLRGAHAESLLGTGRS